MQATLTGEPSEKHQGLLLNACRSGGSKRDDLTKFAISHSAGCVFVPSETSGKTRIQFPIPIPFIPLPNPILPGLKSSHTAGSQY